LGDLPLLLAASPTYTPDFSQPTGASNQCLISTSLGAGTACDVAVQFTPQSVGLLSASIVLTDNNLNLDPATQSVAVSGTGLVSADATAVTVSATPNPANIGASVTITAIVTDIAAGRTANVPTGGVTFMDTIGSTAISLNGGVAVTLDGAGHAVLSGVNLTGAGAHTITANYVGVVNAFLAASGTVTETITALIPTITTLTASPNPVITGQPANLTATVSPAPTGTPARTISFYSGTTLTGHSYSQCVRGSYAYHQRAGGGQRQSHGGVSGQCGTCRLRLVCRRPDGRRVLRRGRPAYAGPDRAGRFCDGQHHSAAAGRPI
jgi:Bacterial Ig-like domain (group 3)